MSLGAMRPCISFLYRQRIIHSDSLAAVMVYAQVISFHFVNPDDPLFVYDNSFVTVFSPAHLAHSFSRTIRSSTYRSRL